MKRDFLRLNDLTRAEIEAVMEKSAWYKSVRRAGRDTGDLKGLSVGMIFAKPSTRTRVSFEVGISELGGRVIYMDAAQTQIARAEPLSHTARVLSRYLDGLVIRTFDQHDLEELARYASIPVINALTDAFHPCQVLSDLFTLREKIGPLDGRKVAWVGDGNNMANSWINAAALMGFELTLAVPQGYDPQAEVLAQAQAKAPAPITVTRDPAEAVTGAVAINTDVWASMGQEAQAAERARVFKPYQVNARLVARAAPQALVLHCLPAHLGEEITEDVLEGPQSVVFDQAENRLHTQKALLALIMGREGKWL
ncbi:MAG: ornithine carbamoyltransferase [Pseudomonadota bacterium]